MSLKRLTAIAAALLCALNLAIPAATMADGTSAVVVNQNDGSDLYRLILQIRREMGDTVDTTNAAVAVSSCNACQTVAVALQGVLVMSDPSVFIPENLAMAININCDLCQTLAIADQTLIQTGGPARLTADGSRRVAEIRRQLEALRNSGLTIDQIQQQVAQLNTQLQTVLLTEVVPAGKPNSSTTPADTGTSTTPSDTGTSTTPSDTGTSTTPSNTGTSTTPTDTGTSTTPSDSGATGPTGPTGPTQ